MARAGPIKSGQPFAKADRDQDFQAIGQALQKGDLAGAQSAFATLESTFAKQSQQSAISAYNANSGTAEIVISVVGTPSSSASSAPATPELVINLGQGSSSSATSPGEITINLGSGSSGGQVLIDAAQGQNNSSSEPVTINLNPQQSKYEIILNLLNASSTRSGNALSVSA